MKKYIIVAVFLIFSLIGLSKEILVKGHITSSNTKVGNVKIIFISSQNQKYSTFSDIFGEYSIEIPMGSYKIDIDRFGYFLNKKNEKVYKLNKNSVLNLSIREKSGFIEGKTLDENLFPVPNTNITIKNGNKFIKLKSNKFGIFNSYLDSGIITIVAEKEGYYKSGDVRFLDRDTSIMNIKIIMNEEKFFIRGITHNGVKSLPNIEVHLHDKNMNRISTTVSDKEGYYEFKNIKGHKKVFLTVRAAKYSKFKSPAFPLNKNYDEQHIYLK